MADAERVRLKPGEYVMTEHEGRFFAVGSVFFGPPSAEAVRQARCCEDGHRSPDEIDACWHAETRDDGTIRGRRGIKGP